MHTHKPRLEPMNNSAPARIEAMNLKKRTSKAGKLGESTDKTKHGRVKGRGRAEEAEEKEQ